MTNDLATALARRYSIDMRNFVVQLNAGEYGDFVSFLDDLDLKESY